EWRTASPATTACRCSQGPTSRRAPNARAWAPARSRPAPTSAFGRARTRTPSLPRRASSWPRGPASPFGGSSHSTHPSRSRPKSIRSCSFHRASSPRSSSHRRSLPIRPIRPSPPNLHLRRKPARGTGRGGPRAVERPTEARLWQHPGVDFDLSAEDVAFRDEFRSWLAEHTPPDVDVAATFEEAETLRDWQRTLHDGRWVGIHWPEEYGGRGASLLQVAIYNE